MGFWGRWFLGFVLFCFLKKEKSASNKTETFTPLPSWLQLPTARVISFQWVYGCKRLCCHNSAHPVCTCCVRFKHASFHMWLRLCWKDSKNICHEIMSLFFFLLVCARATVVHVEKMLLFNSSPSMGAMIIFLAPRVGSNSDFEMWIPEAFQIAQECTRVDDKTSLLQAFPSMLTEKSKMVKHVKLLVLAGVPAHACTPCR